MKMSGSSFTPGLLRQAILMALLPVSSYALGAGHPPGDEAGTGNNTLLVTARPGADTNNGQDPLPAFLDGGIANGARLGVLGEQKALDVPFNVISYTSTLIDSQQARTLQDVVKNDASVQNVRGYGNFSQGFRIRGFDLLGDDIALNGLYGILPRQILPLEDVERVEIIKGSTAFMNGVPAAGSGAGGNINIESKHATSTPVRRISVDYTSRQQPGVSADIGQRFGDRDQFGIRANLVQREGETQIHREKDRTTAAFLGLDYHGDKLESSLDLGYVKSTIHNGRAGIRLAKGMTEVPDAPDPRTNYGQSWSYANLTTRYALLKNDYHLTPDWVFYSAIGANHTNEWSASGSPVVSDLNGDSTMSRLDTHYSADTVAGMAGVRGKFRTGDVSHQVNLGYSGIYNRAGSAYLMSGTFTGPNIYNPSPVTAGPMIYSGGNMSAPSVRSRTVNNGISLSDTLGILDDRLLFTAGARYQKLRVRNYQYSGAEDTASAFDAHRWSPAYGVVWKAQDWLSLYANHTEGLQAAAVAPSNAVNAGQVPGIGRTRQNEVGVKVQRGTFGGNLALFDMRKMAGRLDSDQVYRLTGEQRNQGIEVNIFGEPILGWRVNAGSSWLKPVMHNTSDGSNGKDAVGVPRNQWTLGSEWDIPGVQGVTLSGTLVHTSRQYYDVANTMPIPAWTRLDLGVQYVTSLQETRVTWRAGLENVTNRKYWQTVGQSNGYLTQGDPRTLKLSMSVDF
ncbi:MULTISPECIES: TonB-dependent siderophore receptor [unclassified Tatumella]|uniref:TonB-dependent receptor n=1 Tax=unclassified Tatumella TaxID=2649542 RepID=UPI002012074B|nr:MULTISPECIES: TonB-dependent siderophore receptor [unclassified Tatumella]